MDIIVTHGGGAGPTLLAAFDAALWDAGIAGYNLIILSSAIPRKSVVREGKYDSRLSEMGWRMYCVLSRNNRVVSSSGGWAGLGWAWNHEKGGIFIEEAGDTRDEVAAKIEKAHRDMSARRGDDDRLHSLIIQAPPAEPHSCAVVAAVFEAVPWRM